MIEISQSAAEHLKELMREKGADAQQSGLRLAVEKGGCAGLQYAMSLDEPKPDDTIAERDDAKIFIDPASLPYLEGCVVDYEDGLSGAGFRIRNPNATRSCGCGTSFEPTGAESQQS